MTIERPDEGESDQERVVMCDDKKLAEILRKGGCVIMHKNDIQRLKEARSAGRPCSIFNGVKVYPDNLGLVGEGESRAVLIDKAGINFDFRDSFK